VIIDIVPAVFNRNCTIVLFAGNHGDRFAAETSKGEQERIECIIVRADTGNDIFLSLMGI